MDRKEKIILVVEDEPEIQKLIAMGLEELGAKILSAFNGKQALEILRNNEIDAILSDIRMPQMDGIQLLKEIRALEIEIPFVVLTGNGDKECAVEALRLGALDFIDKPFNEEELVEVMGKAVELGYQSRMLEEEIRELYLKSELPSDRIDYYRQAKKAVIRLRIQNISDQKDSSKNKAG